jgi:hypothetical protein
MAASSIMIDALEARRRRGRKYARSRRPGRPGPGRLRRWTQTPKLESPISIPRAFSRFGRETSTRIRGRFPIRPESDSGNTEGSIEGSPFPNSARKSHCHKLCGSPGVPGTAGRGFRGQGGPFLKAILKIEPPKRHSTPLRVAGSYEVARVDQAPAGCY